MDLKPMRYQIERSIRDFAPRSWDAASGGKLMMSHAWLRCMEDIQKRSSPLYALVSDDAGPLAALAVPYLTTIEPLRILGGPRLAGAVARLVLLATVPFYGEASGLSVRAGVTLEAALPALEPSLRAICRKARRMILAVANVPRGELPAWRALEFQDYELPPGSRLKLSGNYSSYLELLNGRDRRELARMRRVAEHGGTTFECVSGVEDPGVLYDLLCERYAHHGVERSEIELKPELFFCLKNDFPDDVVSFKAKVRGKLAGFMLGVRRRDELCLLFSGYRYELSRPNFVYFLLYDEAVRWSIEHGIRTIDAGSTMLSEKTRQGFEPVPRWVCWRAASRPVRTALSALRRPIRVFLPRAWSMLRRED